MSWQEWAYDSLVGKGVVPDDHIFMAGSIINSPQPPFILIRVNEKNPEFNDGGIPVVMSTRVVIWCYDNSGSYQRIDDMLGQVRGLLVGQVAVTGGIACIWEGDSTELADDVFGALTKNGNYRVVGRL